MKRIVCISALSFICLASFAQAQDSGASAAAAAASRQEAEENYNTLKGHVDDLIQGQADLDHRIQALTKELSDLRAEMSKPSANNYAGQDELKKLADAVQEIDKKREADKELILNELKKLGQVVTATPPEQTSSHKRKISTSSETSGGTSRVSNTSTSSNQGGGEQDGFYYKIKANDTLSLIAQGCREQGIHVTTKQIQEANPNVNPAKLLVDTKIFIPAPKGTVLKGSK